ncbi:hypothetical protein [Hymenobacter jeollabukensis]|uniref:DUF3300 domain-containing protein n=1 Tax=Hymenobacter jeollabukensis TaxID=2025313 RepID=A0A5R8WT33_9BACT|nr:hypothetical protein [Hymenobacter jeollabukensis]TLM94029.1 hypothetical protein FDY95_08345 [Hymenobacter jeollabukensis]
MTFAACLRLLLVPVLLAAACPARAQLADREVPAPRVQVADLPVNLSPLAALDCAPEQLLRALVTELRLQPHQALALRHSLLATPDGAAETTVPAAETLRLLLSNAQLDQLQQLTATPSTVLSTWVALYR